MSMVQWWDTAFISSFHEVVAFDIQEDNGRTQMMERCSEEELNTSEKRIVALLTSDYKTTVLYEMDGGCGKIQEATRGQNVSNYRNNK